MWGRLTKEDVLWIESERYLSSTLPQDHAAALKALGNVRWHADPADPGQIAEYRAAGMNVQPAHNDIRLGIAAVTSRIQTGRLMVRRATCPELVREAGLYHYPSPDERRHHGEGPVDEFNHALAALRYLVMGHDKFFLARARRPAPAEPVEQPADDHLWTTLR